MYGVFPFCLVVEYFFLKDLGYGRNDFPDLIFWSLSNVLELILKFTLILYILATREYILNKDFYIVNFDEIVSKIYYKINLIFK